jgi:hypothetical protein
MPTLRPYDVLATSAAGALRRGDPHPDLKWIEVIDSKMWCMAPVKSAYIGSLRLMVCLCTATFIRRDAIRSVFHHEMVSLSEAHNEFAFTLFDQLGCLQSTYRVNDPQHFRSSSDMGLDQGDLLLIDLLEVPRGPLGLHLAQRMIKLLMERIAEISDCCATFVRLEDKVSKEWQSGATKPTEEQIKSAHQGSPVDYARLLFLELGFKRVGSSLWFVRPTNIDPLTEIVSTGLD